MVFDPGSAIAQQGRRAILAMVVLWLSAGAAPASDPALTPLAQLGKRVFFYQTLSRTGSQSCASCHAPDVGFSGPNERFNRMGAYEGAVHGEFGKRKPQTAAYVGPSPVLQIAQQGAAGGFAGGSFWDGRAQNTCNGANPFGERDASSHFFFATTATAPLTSTLVRLKNSSLCSQALGPPGSDFEMSAAKRTFRDIGRKLLFLASVKSPASRTPLAKQKVDVTDSVLGKTSVGSAFGAAGSLAVLLVWIYYSAQIVLLGAEFTRVYANRFGEKVRPSRQAVPAQTAANERRPPAPDARPQEA